ncbi:MAG: hypothetical protein K8U03_14025 [Planctomycetia bacterium]|nr:hypothetical protein [Planctomycetia bacterium]
MKATLLAASVLSALISAPIFAGEYRDPQPFPALPEAVSSFGAAVDGNYVYAFSGHMGRVRGNSSDGLNPNFSRLDISKPGAKWETLAMHRPSQSPGLVAWNGAVYRVGGLNFKNKAGEKTVYESLDVFAKYDPATNAWRELAPLPKPRSSLDAAVVDGKLYVVGGWNLQASGSDDAAWNEDALVFDLADDKGSWKPIAKPPFVARAIAAAGHDGKLYVLGGMTADHEITKAVHVFDPKTNQWSKGPELKAAGKFGAFAISAFAADGRLFYSGSDGIVYELHEGREWKLLERLLHPRSFHRLVVSTDTLVVMAGVSGGGYLANVEVVDLKAKNRGEPKFTRWETKFEGEAKQSQLVLLHEGGLFAFGGNKSRDTHGNAADSFSDQAFRFSVANRSVEKLSNMPRALRSGTLAVTGERPDQLLHVMGGLAVADGKYGSTNTIYSYRLGKKTWAEETVLMPTQRSMFRVGRHDGKLWIFGGSEVSDGKRGVGSVLWRWSGDSSKAVEIVEGKPLPHPRRSGGGAQIGDKYFLVGGLGADSQIAKDVDVFDMKTQTWSNAASPNVPRWFNSLASAGGKLYLSGGLSGFSNEAKTVPSLEVYDPKTDKWTTLLENQPAGCANTQLFEYQGRLLYYGLDPEKDGVATFALFDPTPLSEEISAD